MVEWINYLEATTSSTMISLTPQNAQLRRRFPFFLFIFFFDYCSSIGAVAILYQRYRKKKNIVSRSIVCVVFHSMLIGPVSQYNDAQRGNLYEKNCVPITANDSPLAANNKI